MTGRPAIPADTLARQARACDPEASAWVGANAGSGKTFVLTQRVVRLLLDGADPGRVLCLTFTKAAAAEMANRVFATLAAWTQLEDKELESRLYALEGRPVSKRKLRSARQLFARALETPGGLKIQTVHAFCEALLHQFPLEANVAGHFDVLDDRGKAELLAEAQDSVLNWYKEAMNEKYATDKLDTNILKIIMRRASDPMFLSAVSELVSRREELAIWLRSYPSEPEAVAALARTFGLESDDDADSIASRISESDTFSSAYVSRILPVLDTGKVTDQKLALRLKTARNAEVGEARMTAWLDVFFTRAGEPRADSRVVTNAVLTDIPDIKDRFRAEIDRLLDLRDKYRAAVTVEATAAIVRLSRAVIARYETRKAALGRLDFDDLVIRTADLLSRSEAARWVQYKMDRGIDHVLVDEGQDTSPWQWRVITGLVDEFFSGEGARDGRRTIFAVGDEKQSIYSFQGAAPRYFADMRKQFMAEAAAAGHVFHDERLYLSFRSTPDVLGAVDTVFADPDNHKGLTHPPEPTIHEAIRINDPGYVEIWPLIHIEPKDEPDDWRLPLDHGGPAEPAYRLAERIADTIAGWIESGERLEGTGKRIAPGDILVLVRKRGPFVEAFNRALKTRRIPAAGSDRLVVGDHVAVMDLVSLARVALLPGDDLALAELLKSPIVGLDEDALFDLAAYRPPSQTLYETLRERSVEQPFDAVYGIVADAIARADLMPPYEFFTDLLGRGGGRARFRARLGAEVDEILDEFLALTLTYEQSVPPSLEGFLAWLAAAPAEIKRQQEADAREVRVMTVHGAKGLEAPVVFLVDPCSAPFHRSHAPAIMMRDVTVDGRTVAAPVWTPGSDAATDWNRNAVSAHADSQADEYRRLLYVAMTRAGDRLIVCGYRGKREPGEDVWYRRVRAALEPGLEPILDVDGEAVAWRWRKTERTPRPAVDDMPSTSEFVERPDWLDLPAAAPEHPRRVIPSRFTDANIPTDDAGAGDLLGAAFAPGDSGARRGVLIHLLLELLPDIDEDDRPSAAAVILEKKAPSLAPGERARLAAEALGVLDHPDFRSVFSKDSRAEVAIAGRVSVDGKELDVSGQVDRLVVTDTELLIVDFKSDRKVPNHADTVPPAYLAQLALYRAVLCELYPDHIIRSALLWTSAPKLMEFPTDTLDHALRYNLTPPHA